VSRIFSPDRPPCDVCREIWDDKGADPPCGECMPEPLPENRLAVEILLNTANQIIFAGMGEPVDINLQAVELAMRMRGTDDHVVFDKVVMAARHIIHERRERGK